MRDKAIRSTAVLILGMHRSGTSSVTGVLQRLGVDLGRDLGGPAADNLKGHFEHIEIVHLHEAILMALGTAWDDPCSLPSGWQRSPGIQRFRERLAAIIVRDFAQSRVWAVKDPRLCRLLPLWLDVLNQLNIEAKAVLVVRDPSDVVASLSKRDGMDIEQGMMLWLSHVLASEYDTRDIARTVVLYEDLLFSWKAEVQQLCDNLGIDLPGPSQQVSDQLSAFLDTDLHHHRKTPFPSLRAPQNSGALKVFESMAAWRRDSILPSIVCTQAANETTFAQQAAIPIVAFVRSKALDLNAHLQAALQDSFAARRSLEGQLVIERQANLSKSDRTS